MGTPYVQSTYLATNGREPINTLEPKAVIRRYYEEIGNQRRLAVADEIVAPHFKLFPDSSPRYGPEGVKQFISWLCITTLPDLHVTIKGIRSGTSHQ